VGCSPPQNFNPSCAYDLQGVYRLRRNYLFTCKKSINSAEIFYIVIPRLSTQPNIFAYWFRRATTINNTNTYHNMANVFYDYLNNKIDRFTYIKLAIQTIILKIDHIIYFYYLLFTIPYAVRPTACTILIYFNYFEYYIIQLYLKIRRSYFIL